MTAARPPVVAAFVPPRLTNLSLWAGLYGGHYDTIVFFRERPTRRMTRAEDGHPRGAYVDVSAEHKAGNVFADMALGSFQDWWPHADLRPHTRKNGRPRDTEIRYKDLFRITITFPLDADGAPVSLPTHEDW